MWCKAADKADGKRENTNNTHTHKKKRVEGGGGRERKRRRRVKGEARKLEEFSTYIRIHTRTHAPTHPHVHTDTRAHASTRKLHLSVNLPLRKKRKKILRRLSNPVDGPLLKQNGISQTRSSYFVKGVSKVESNAIRRGTVSYTHLRAHET